MEGIEVEQSSTATRQFVPFEDHRYPLSLQQRIQQGDQFRRSSKELLLALQRADKSYSKRGDAHTATPECLTCVSKRQRIWQAYASYYLGEEPGRWDASLPEYRKELAAMLASPEKFSLEDIDARSSKELREHLRKDLLARYPATDPKYAQSLVELSESLMKMFDEDKPMEDIIKKVSDFERGPPQPIWSDDELKFLDLIHAATTPQEECRAFREYYCSSYPTEPSQHKNMKVKYERQFNGNTSPESVIAAWKAEALQLQQEGSRNLTTELDSLKLAQSHQKKKEAAKQAEEDQKQQDVSQKATARCSMRECGREVDLEAEDGVLQCAVCDWLANKPSTDGEKREHAYYCSEIHVREAFEDHDQYEHACSMDFKCIYEGREVQADTGDGGICKDCLNAGYINYFCSRDCWDTNMNSHRDEFHHGRGIDNQNSELEMYQSEPDLVIIPS